jgi:hypothetical protein
MDSRRKNNNNLFDKLWYTKRQEANRVKRDKLEGFVFDGQGFVVNSGSLDKMDKEAIQNTETASRRNSVRFGGALKLKTVTIPEMTSDSSTSSLTEKLSEENGDEVLSNRADLNAN